MTGYCQVTTTVPDRATADRLAGTLVGERLAACAQIHGPIESTYRWRDAIERATEWGADAIAALRQAGATHVIIAGRPGDLDVDDSCAMGVDALAFLTRTREQLQ